MFGRIMREPLLHFAVMAAAMLGLYSLIQDKEENTPDRITATAFRTEQLTGIFAKTYQRPPNKKELKGLIDDYVKEDIYALEAVQLGLDKDYAVIRRSLRQKMEFTGGAAAGPFFSSDVELANRAPCELYGLSA